ncbi:uncharacterized protein LOC131436195 [Malaya genurostris]|uniref:uncharacterized protein LOC131436195 n=1 Tax=Malaya genurostris TaxID=325434 RepID=UPI0026F3F271|nr:uncharacterized protein LOC131436195 [Malaya genurostris]
MEVHVSKILIRVLNARERRRFETFRMLPLNAIDPKLKRRVMHDFDIQLYEYEPGYEVKRPYSQLDIASSGSGADNVSVQFDIPPAESSYVSQCSNVTTSTFDTSSKLSEMLEDSEVLSILLLERTTNSNHIQFIKRIY